MEGGAEYRAIFAFHLPINTYFQPYNKLTIITEKSAGPTNYNTPAATTSVTQIGL